MQPLARIWDLVWVLILDDACTGLLSDGYAPLEGEDHGNLMGTKICRCVSCLQCPQPHPPHSRRGRVLPLRTGKSRPCRSRPFASVGSKKRRLLVAKCSRRLRRTPLCCFKCFETLLLVCHLPLCTRQAAVAPKYKDFLQAPFAFLPRMSQRDFWTHSMREPLFALPCCTTTGLLLLCTAGHIEARRAGCYANGARGVHGGWALAWFSPCKQTLRRQEVRTHRRTICGRSVLTDTARNRVAAGWRWRPCSRYRKDCARSTPFVDTAECLQYEANDQTRYEGHCRALLLDMCFLWACEGTWGWGLLLATTGVDGGCYWLPSIIRTTSALGRGASCLLLVNRSGKTSEAQLKQVCDGVSPIVTDPAKKFISSTAIRKALMDADFGRLQELVEIPGVSHWLCAHRQDFVGPPHI